MKRTPARIVVRLGVAVGSPTIAPSGAPRMNRTDDLVPDPIPTSSSSGCSTRQLDAIGGPTQALFERTGDTDHELVGDNC